MVKHKKKTSKKWQFEVKYIPMDRVQRTEGSVRGYVQLQSTDNIRRKIRNGIRLPAILVVYFKQYNLYAIQNGHHRHAAAYAEKLTKIPAYVIPSEQEWADRVNDIFASTPTLIWRKHRVGTYKSKLPVRPQRQLHYGNW